MTDPPVTVGVVKFAAVAGALGEPVDVAAADTFENEHAAAMLAKATAERTRQPMRVVKITEVAVYQPPRSSR